ncbi:MAG: aminopeptidase [Candidatus Hodarchaeales archaeon]|jgi:aminopeptidase
MYADYSEKLAQLIVNYSVGVQPDDTVVITSPINAEDLTREVFREVIRAGGHVVRLNLSFNGQNEIFYKYSTDEQLKYVDPLALELYKTVKKAIHISSDYNTRSLTNIAPEKKAMVANSRKELNEIYLNRAATKELKWNLCSYPCDSFAQEANMGRIEYLEFVYKALNLHQPDPVQYWKGVETDQQKIVDILNRGSEFQIIGEDTDLTLTIKDRKWINCCGHENLPDGEVFTGPHEDAVNGTIRFTYPGIYQGQEIEDVRLTFKDGKVIKSDASKGKELLEKLLSMTSNADTLGELAVGTNYGIDRFTKNMLFDEKMGGTVHLALGSGYPETGSKNVSAIHWDILKDMKNVESKILLDGELIYKEGKWLI